MKDKILKFCVIAILLAILVALPQCCKAERPIQMSDYELTTEKVDIIDTVNVDLGAICNVFQKKTAKSVKYYAVYSYCGVEDVAPIAKSVVDYLEICREAKISPKLALRVKNGQVISVIRAKNGKIKIAQSR